jgi:hypothetical protein
MRELRYSSTLSLISTLDGVDGQRPVLFTPGKDTVNIIQEAGWVPGPVWTGVENFISHRVSIPQTVEPVARRYTDWAIPAHNSNGGLWIFSAKMRIFCLNFEGQTLKDWLSTSQKTIKNLRYKDQMFRYITDAYWAICRPLQRCY